MPRGSDASRARRRARRTAVAGLAAAAAAGVILAPIAAGQGSGGQSIPVAGNFTVHDGGTDTIRAGGTARFDLGAIRGRSAPFALPELRLQGGGLQLTLNQPAAGRVSRVRRSRGTLRDGQALLRFPPGSIAVNRGAAAAVGNQAAGASGVNTTTAVARARIDGPEPNDPDRSSRSVPTFGQNPYRCYAVVSSPRHSQRIQLEDQFGKVSTRAAQAVEVCNPTLTVIDGSISIPLHDISSHLVGYRLRGGASPPQTVRTRDFLFGRPHLRTGRRTALLVPSRKRLRSGPGFDGIRTIRPTAAPDHFACYSAATRERRERGNSLLIEDQFRSDTNVRPARTVSGICNPTLKVHGGRTTRVQNHDSHFTSYRISGPSQRREVTVTNQFGRNQRLVTGAPTRLLVRADKRQCSRFDVKTNIPLRNAAGAVVATVRGFTFTPHATAEDGPC